MSFDYIDTWLFDLDDTLYPVETGMMDLIRNKITGFVMRVTGSDEEEARYSQRGWFEAHGGSLPGLLKHHDVSVREFLDEIHDVPLDSIEPHPDLGRALARQTGRRLVFTNVAADHAARPAHASASTRSERRGGLRTPLLASGPARSRRRVCRRPRSVVAPA